MAGGYFGTQHGERVQARVNYPPLVFYGPPQKRDYPAGLFDRVSRELPPPYPQGGLNRYSFRSCRPSHGKIFVPAKLKGKVTADERATFAKQLNMRP